MKTDYQTLKTLIEQGQKNRQLYFDRRAERNKRWYGGSYSNDGTYGNGQGECHLDDQPNTPYSVNLTKQIVSVIKTSIYSKFPEFSFYLKGNVSQSDQAEIQRAAGQFVSGTGVQLNKLSRLLELGIKIILKEMKVNKTTKRVIRDAVLFGIGYGKIGYKYRFDAKTEEQLAPGNQDLSKIGLSGNDVEVSDLVKSEKSSLVRVDPRTMILPPEYPDSLPWLCQEIYLDKEAAEKKYKVKGLSVVTVGNSYDLDKRYLLNKVKIYEMHIFDEESPKVVIMAEGHDGIIKQTEQPLVDESGNVTSLFKILCFNDPIDEIYPQSDIDIVAPQILEGNVQIQRRVENARKYTNQYVLTGSWGNDEKDGIKKGKDGDIHHVLDANAKVQIVPRLQNGQEFYANISAIRSEAFEILGLTDYSVGGRTQKRKATEAYFVEAGRKDRVNERMVIIEEFSQDIVDTLVELLKKYQVSDRIFRLQYENNDIALTMNSKLLTLTDSDVIVVSGSTIELDQNFQLKKAKATAEAAQAFGEVTDQRVVARMVFKELGWANPDQFLLDVPSQPVSRPGQDGRTPVIPGQSPQPGEVDLGQQQKGGVTA